MKRRSREISIFSMSALDLFASALGAFILIAIVIFPYFPNTARTPVVVVAAPSPEPCPPVLPCPPVPDPAPACPPCPPAPEPAPPATQFPHLDLVVALDVSGSMGRQITSLKAEVDQLSSLLIALTPSLGMGMVAFGDRQWDRPVTSFALREISASPAGRSAFQDFVAGLDANMGLGGGANPDGPEAFYRALTEAARMGWRPDAELRMVVLITDNPAYPDEARQAVADAASFASAGNSRVSTVYIETGDRPAAEAFLERVADAGRGQFVRNAGGSVTVTLLLSLL